MVINITNIIINIVFNFINVIINITNIIINIVINTVKTQKVPTHYTVN